jgi:hypothetical protein
MRALTTAAILLLFTGCVTTTTTTTAQAPAPATGAQTFSGEVWTWDQPNNIVTLFKDGQATRVKVSPETMRTLRLHEQARVTGELAPPADLLVVTNAGPMTPVPRGQAETMEVKGTVASVDPNGRIAVTSDRGPVHVWGAAGADQRFAKGSPVSVKMSVQPVDMRPAAAGQPASAMPAAASPSSEPGDHAVITGRIIGVNPGGILVVESPTGPIQVLVADGAKYKVGDYVEIRTTVHTASS